MSSRPNTPTSASALLSYAPLPIQTNETQSPMQRNTSHKLQPRLGSLQQQHTEDTDSVSSSAVSSLPLQLQHQMVYPSVSPSIQYSSINHASSPDTDIDAEIIPPRIVTKHARINQASRDDSQQLVSPEPNTPMPLKKKRASVLRLALATICFAGLQFGWALQIAMLTPFMLVLGLPDALVSITWLCGPLGGIIMQPLVGALSDRFNTRMGRRSPWILAGAFFVAFSLLLIPNAPDLGYIFIKKQSGNWITIVLATAGFWILDFANNMMQGPCRALLADIAPNSQQATGSAIFSVWLALGNVTGYMAGFVDWSRWTGFTTTEVCTRACVNLRTAFLISCFFLIVTTIITLIFARERKTVQRPARLNDEYTDGMHRYQSSTRSGKARSFMLNLCKNIIFDNPATVIGVKMASLPWTMKYVLLVTFFSWFGWFAFLIYITHWMGAGVFQGSPDMRSEEYALYEEGVRWGAFGLAGNAAISFVFSPFVPYLIRIMGHKLVWFAGQLCLFLSLLLPAFVYNKWAAVAVISSFGIPWSITMTVPFALSAIIAPDEDKGIYMGILNIAVTAPQLLMAAMGPLFSWLFDKNPVAPLVAGSASALFSALLCILLIPSRPARNPVAKRPVKQVIDSDDEFEAHMARSRATGHVVLETDIVDDRGSTSSEEHFVMEPA